MGGGVELRVDYAVRPFPPGRKKSTDKREVNQMKALRMVLLLVLATGALAAEKTVFLEDFDASW